MSTGDAGAVESLMAEAAAHRNAGRLDEAVASLRRAGGIDSGAFGPHFELGMIAVRRNRADEAAAEFEAAVRAAPDSADAWHMLGRACYALKKADRAEQAQRRALALRPGYSDAEHNLGLILFSLGRQQEGMTHLEAALAGNPDDGQLLTNIANVHFMRKNHASAAVMLERAVALRPDDFELRWNLSRAYWTLKDWPKAAEILRKIIEMRPSVAMSHFLHGLAIEHLGDRDGAKAEMQRALDLGLKHPRAEFFAHTMIGGHFPHTPPEVVAGLFDSYADNFEKSLVTHLQYQGHMLIEMAVKQVGISGPVDILDAGCGTGLCGALLKPMARKLIGVDLAAKMIEKSRERNIYDELIVGDATEAIRRYPDALDLVVAGDMLIYVGEASELFDAVATALRDGGLFAFTIETNDQEGVRLMPSQRFKHSLSYIRGLSAARGLRELHSSSHSLRIEAGQPVPAHVIVVGKR